MKNFWQDTKANIYMQLYDDLASSLQTDEELKFLKKEFSKNKNIIEFGCGTGRTLIPLLKGGYQISGLDFSMGMIDNLRKKLHANKLETSIFHKNLITFSLGNTYDAAILSQRTLNFITTQEDQKKALLNIARVLKKGSTLVINLMPARPHDFAERQVEPKKTEGFTNSITGNAVEFFESWIPKPMDQIWEFTNIFVEKNNKISTKMKMRVIFEAEMKNLLELCGFKLVHIYGNWKGKKYDEKSKDLILVASKL